MKIISRSSLQMCLFLIMMLCSASTALSQNMMMTEIMFNPNGSDAGAEWIEIYAEECINLTKYKLYEADINHKITEYNKTSKFNSSNPGIFCSYAIISNDAGLFVSKYPDSNASIYESVFSLNNDGEFIGIKLGEEFIDYIDYGLIKSSIAVEEGYSIENNAGTWTRSINFSGSPGTHIKLISETAIETNVTNSTNNITENNLTNHTNNTYNNTNTSNSIDENMTSNTTINESYANETIELNLSENISANISQNNILCLIELKLELRNNTKETTPIISNNEQIRFKNKIIFIFNNTNFSEKDINYSVEYWIEDLLGNIVKNKVVTNNQDYKSYTPKIKTKDEVFIIKNKIISISPNPNCSMTPSGEKMIIIKNSQFNENIDGESEEYCIETKKKSDINTTKECNCDALLSSMQREPPQLKILNVCNMTVKNYDSSQIESEQKGKSSDASIDYLTFDSDDQEIQNNTRNSSSKITTMISYESENIKNKIYAIIGLVILAIASLVLILRKHFKP